MIYHIFKVSIDFESASVLEENIPVGRPQCRVSEVDKDLQRRSGYYLHANFNSSWTLYYR